MGTQRLSDAGKFLLSALALSGAIALPAAAQQGGRQTPAYNQDVSSPTQQDNLRMAVTNLNQQRAELFRRKDAAGIAAMYTADTIFVQLLPRLDVMRGRGQVQAHFQELFAANATDLTPTITTAEMGRNGEIIAGGDYSLSAGAGKKINGHFFQTLRQENGTWKIAMHAFARPEPVTPIEMSQYNSASGN